MSAEPPDPSGEPSTVASRRPGPGRIAGFAILLAAVSWSLGAFAAWPWTASAPDAAVLRVSMRHVSAFASPGTRLSDAEIAKLPPHMRPRDPARPVTGRRADVTLAIGVDGAPLFTQTYRPTGFRGDGPVYAYEELSVAPGRHAVRVTVTDQGAGGPARERVFARDIDFAPGQAPLVEFAGEAWHP